MSQQTNYNNEAYQPRNRLMGYCSLTVLPILSLLSTLGHLHGPLYPCSTSQLFVCLCTDWVRDVVATLFVELRCFFAGVWLDTPSDLRFRFFRGAFVETELAVSNEDATSRAFRLLIASGTSGELSRICSTSLKDSSRLDTSVEIDVSVDIEAERVRLDETGVAISRIYISKYFLHGAWFTYFVSTKTL